MTVFLPALESAAIAVVFTRGTIFKRLRESGPALWRDLTSCPLCVGVWVGGAWSIATRSQVFSLPAVAPVALEALAVGTWSGVFALAISYALNILDKHA